MVKFYSNNLELLVVGIRLDNGLLLILHEDTVATYKVCKWDPEEYTEVAPVWEGDELRDKLLQWGARVHTLINLGVDTALKNLGKVTELYAGNTAP